MEKQISVVNLCTITIYMYEHQTTVRVRYAETDPMNVVYYGNYAQYFEVGRVESFRELGFSYKIIEELGIMLPVVELNIKYLRPARYDDLLTIKSQIKTLPTDHRIIFDQEILLLYYKKCNSNNLIFRKFCKSSGFYTCSSRSYS